MNELSNNGVDGQATAGAKLSLSDRVRSLQLPDRPAAHARGTSWLPWALCGLLGMVAVYAGFFRPNEDKDYQDYLELKKTVANPVEMLTAHAKEQENKAKRNDPVLGAHALESK